MTQDDDGARPGVRAERPGRLRLQVPPWLRTVGTGSWFVVGALVVVAVALFLFAKVTPVLIPLIIAAVLAAILVPVVDRLERWHVPRWLGAALLLLVGLSAVVVLVVVVVRVIIGQSGAIWAEVQAGLQSIADRLDLPDGWGARLVASLRSGTPGFLVGGLGFAISSVTALVVGVVLGVFMLLFLLKDWVPITRWTTHHVGVPAPLAQDVLDGTVHAFRGYALGLTMLGVANAVVVAVGALIFGVPLVGAIAVVTFVASYVPYFGACVAGAFAVVVAFGDGGLPVALAMLAVVLLANNTIQNLLEPFAFGRPLRLHPLVVLLVTTAGTLLFGLMGAILAAPVTSACLNALRVLREAGLFEEHVVAVEHDAGPTG
ncbi:AI-2E family transporter [Luteimicrobium sp. DT211]|uniref:AI-2E family transporter n=1 Tax=Luteimicrobium sp. DT211 TaxID=3393412 RepID=UPI003CE756AB